MQRVVFTFLVIIVFVCMASAQQNIGINTTTPDSSAVMDISSSDKGLLIPRMDSFQRQTIPDPADGLMVFDSTTNSFWYYVSPHWQEVTKIDDDPDPQNEIQNLSYNPGTRELAISDGDTVNLSGLANQPETDPEVGIINLNRVPLWDGTALVSSAIIDEVGKVGIGTSGLENIFSVDGTASGEAIAYFEQSTSSSGSHAVQGNIVINGPTKGFLGVQGQTAFDGDSTLNTNGGEIGVLGISTGISNNDNFGIYGHSNGWGGKFQHQTSGNQVFAGGSAKALAVQGDAQFLDGNVSIGNNSPGELLDVRSPANIPGDGARIGNTKIGVWSGSSGFAAFSHDNMKNNLSGYALLQSSAGATILNSAAGENLQFRNGNTNSMILDPTGNLGLGTSSPVNKFDVEGAVAIGGGYAGATTAPFQGLIVEGSVGIGISNPSEKLTVAGNVYASSGDFITASSNGVINAGGSINDISNVIGDVAAPTQTFATADEDLWIQDDLEVLGQGYKTGGGSWANVSDIRFKKDIAPYQDGLEQLRQIKPVWYTYNEKLGPLAEGRRYVGIIAQDMQDIAPYMVEEKAFFRKEREREDGTLEIIDPGEKYLTYDGSALVYMLVNATKEQQEVIGHLEGQVRDLNHTIEYLIARIEKLESAKEN